MPHLTRYAGLILISGLLFMSCSQNENPTTASSSDQTKILAKPPNQQTRTALHSQLGSAASYVSGTVSGMNFTIGNGPNGIEVLDGPAELTLHGAIAEKIRALCEYGGTGSKTISGALTIRNYGTEVISWFNFQGPGVYSYMMRIGFPNSSRYPDNEGSISGSFADGSTVTFDGKVFEISKINRKGQGLTWLWPTSSDDPFSATVSYTIVTSAP